VRILIASLSSLTSLAITGAEKVKKVTRAIIMDRINMMCLSLDCLKKSAPYFIPKISLADRQQKLYFDYRAPV
jgi:hypothetical protein